MSKNPLVTECIFLAYLEVYKALGMVYIRDLSESESVLNMSEKASAIEMMQV